MKTVKRTYKSMSDGGHGWLSVPYADIVSLCLWDKISSFSYMNGTRVYLEEDCDASIFMDAAISEGWDITLKQGADSYGPSPIRSLASYNAHWLLNPIYIGRECSVHSEGNFIVTSQDKRHWFLSPVNVPDYQCYRIKKSNPFTGINPPIQRETIAA